MLGHIVCHFLGGVQRVLESGEDALHVVVIRVLLPGMRLVVVSLVPAHVGFCLLSEHGVKLKVSV